MGLRTCVAVDASDVSRTLGNRYGKQYPLKLLPLPSTERIAGVETAAEGSGIVGEPRRDTLCTVFGQSEVAIAWAQVVRVPDDFHVQQSVISQQRGNLT